MNILQAQEKYKEDFFAYLQTLPEERRIEELENFKKMNQNKSSSSKNKKNSASDKTQPMVKNSMDLLQEIF